MPLFLRTAGTRLMRFSTLLLLAAALAATLPHGAAEASAVLPGAESLQAAPLAGFDSGLDGPRSGSSGGGMLDGSFLGALLLGKTFTGIGTADIGLLVALAAAGLLLTRRRQINKDDDRFTVDRKKAGSKEQERLSAPLRRSRPLDARRPSGTPPESGRGGPEPRPGGLVRDDDPQADLKRNAAAHWAHFSSGQKVQMPGGSRAPAGPDGFDTADFLEGARVLYVRLQQAWAARDVGDLAPFVTKRMFRVLEKQAALDPTPSPMAVLLVDADFGDLEQTPDEERATVRFDALLETEGGKKSEVRELWRFVRKVESGATWRLSGIEPDA